MSRNQIVRCAGIVAMAMMVLPSTTFARHGKSPEDWANHKTEKLTKRLSLTDEQAQKVRGILEASHAEKQAAQEAMLKRKEQTDQEILAVLSEEQKAQYTKVMEARKKNWDKHGKDRGWQFWRKHSNES